MKETTHPKPGLEIWCPKCGAFTGHVARDAQWMECLGCGDLHDLADPGTRVAETTIKGKREKRV